MVGLNIDEIVLRLRELHTNNPRLAARNEFELHLPENPAIELAAEIEEAYRRCENSTPADRDEKFEQLGELLVVSYRYYLERLREADNPWLFVFPAKTESYQTAVLH